MATFEELGDNLENQIENFFNFKIGKTGQTIEERYEQEYKNYYNNYMIVGTSKNKSTIDDFEKYLIDRFYEFINCNNEQVGGGDMTDSDEYIVYVVYNNK